MEPFSVEKSLYDIGENDLKEIWDTDFDSPMQDLHQDGDWTHLLDSQPILLHDRMFTDAARSPRIQSEHSYSLVTSDENGEGHFLNKYHIDFSKDLESECFPTIPMSTSSSHSSVEQFIKKEPIVYIKEEPLSCPSSPEPDLSEDSPPCPLPPITTLTNPHRPCQQSLLKHSRHHRLAQPRVSVKTEPGFSLPPTPPSSHESDSEGAQSPVHSNPPSSPIMPTSLSEALATPSARRPSAGRSLLTSSNCLSASSCHTSRANTSSPCPLISSQPKGATGVLLLTEEEKRTLVQEGYPVPTRLPLSKAEEKSLKKIRRKIKNKISAQESRRKKKEYMDTLEKKVETLVHENGDYRRKMDCLETSNQSLLFQLQQLQALVGDIPSRVFRTVSTQTSTSCLMPKKSVSRSGNS